MGISKLFSDRSHDDFPKAEVSRHEHDIFHLWFLSFNSTYVDTWLTSIQTFSNKLQIRWDIC